MRPARRSFLAACAATALPAPAVASTTIRAVAFDGIALFDPSRAEVLLARMFPARAKELGALWRMRQFEYTWLRTAMNRYADFERVTEESLVFAARALNVELADTQREALVAAFRSLSAWPDVRPSLEALRERGYRTAIVSNFTGAMIEAAVRNAGIAGLIDWRLSTDLVRAYKPDPRAYAMAVEAFAMPREAICFVAFAGWDAAGAQAFGHPVYWANRARMPVEQLGYAPEAAFPGLAQLPGFLSPR